MTRYTKRKRAKEKRIKIIEKALLILISTSLMSLFITGWVLSVYKTFNII